MQPLNEALLTDEEFISLIKKKIEAPIPNAESITVRAETINRLLGIIEKNDRALTVALNAS